MPNNKMASAFKLVGTRSTKAKAAASPIEMPLRFTSNGRQTCSDMSCKELKPYKVVKHKVSTPPTMAASIKPASNILRAVLNTLALDEHAEEITTAGPSKSKYERVKSATE